MKYLINCVSSEAELIEAMVDEGTEIEFWELLEHITQEDIDELFPVYIGIPLTLESDYSTSYFKSVYDGEECVYIDHSRVEYVFTN